MKAAKAPSAIAMMFLWTLSVFAQTNEQPVMQGEVTLDADIASGKSATAQIQDAFGAKSIEAPDFYEGNHPGVEHIRLEEDPAVGGSFVFYIHRDQDEDKDKGPSDRQRNEIKAYDDSSEILKAVSGETVRYSWRFRIGKEMTFTKNFTHFFQLKAVGGDDGMPLFTLTGAVSGGTSRLEFRNSVAAKEKLIRIPIADLDSCKDKWLEVECLVKYQDAGYLKLSVRSADGALNFSKELSPIDTWRDGISFVRPKWGIYRSLSEKEKIASEEDKVAFANFSVQEWSDLPKAKASGR